MELPVCQPLDRRLARKFLDCKYLPDNNYKLEPKTNGASRKEPSPCPHFKNLLQISVGPYWVKS